MTRLTTQFDQFIGDVTRWVDGAWYVWLTMALFIVFATVIVAVAKARAKARARVPQYRRQRR